MKFQYQQSIIEFLNYIIGKYKEMEQGINSYMDWWNVYAFKRQTLDNMIHIAQGFKAMIISILKQLSVNSGIIKNGSQSKMRLSNKGLWILLTSITTLLIVMMMI